MYIILLSKVLKISGGLADGCTLVCLCRHDEKLYFCTVNQEALKLKIKLARILFKTWASFR